MLQQLAWLQLGLKYLSVRVWTAEIGKELVCHRVCRNAHDFNPTKCTTISNFSYGKYGMNVDDEAKVYPYPGASRHTCARCISPDLELLGAVGTPTTDVL